MPNSASESLYEIEQLKTLKARYFRFLDTKQWVHYRGCFTDDFQFFNGEDKEALVKSGDEYVAWAAKIFPIGEVTTVHQGHLGELELTSERTATGVWSMFDWIDRKGYPETRQGYGHYHEHYEKGADGKWRIKSARLTRLRLDQVPRPGYNPAYEIEQIKALKAKYWRCLDKKLWKEHRECFTEDFRFFNERHEEPIADGAEDFISKLSAMFPPGKAITVHQGHNPEITLTSERTATGIWALFDWIDVAARPTMMHGYGHYHDKYEKGADGRWRLKESLLTRIRTDQIERKR